MKKRRVMVNVERGLTALDAVRLGGRSPRPAEIMVATDDAGMLRLRAVEARRLAPILLFLADHAEANEGAGEDAGAHFTTGNDE